MYLICFMVYWHGWANHCDVSSLLISIGDIFNLANQVCMEVPETECELVGYTECDSTKDSMPARDDKVKLLTTGVVTMTTAQVVGEFFNEQDCSTRPITVTEIGRFGITSVSPFSTIGSISG